MSLVDLKELFDLPILEDEAAFRMSELLCHFARAVEEHYYDQIWRYYAEIYLDQELRVEQDPDLKGLFDLPILEDEAAVQLSELLHHFADAVQEYYYDQISRYYGKIDLDQELRADEDDDIKQDEAAQDDELDF
jgi:hypothetical protein